MQNGDSINCCNTLWVDFKNDGYPVLQGAYILPLPNSSHIYYLFHAFSLYFPSNPTTICIPELRYSIIDMNGNNGRGRVVQKNTPVIPYSLNGGCFAVTKHGNGRDWWLVTQSFDLSKFYTLLFTPSGIQGPFTQITHNVVTSAYCGGGTGSFTPDGSKYTLYDPKIGTQIYDFDRCEGVFSNQHILPVEDPTNQWAGNLVSSPNSEYAYLVHPLQIKQINLSTYTVDTVANYDGFVYQNNLRTPFALPALAPDGKIYITCPGGKRYLHTIENPDAAGAACNVQQHSIFLPTTNASTINIAPNYRLGAKAGSGCDTIYTAAESPALGWAGGLQLFPNPATSKTRLVWGEPLKQHTFVKITNSIGQVVRSIAIEKGFTYQEIDLKDLPNGLYFVSLPQQTIKLLKIE
jgi:hypothetical protein